MWTVNSIQNNTAPAADISFSDGQPINMVRGPEGACFRLLVAGHGYIDLTDTGHQPGGPHYWQIIINDAIYWYDGQGAISLTINNNGSYQVTGDNNNFSGQVMPFESINSDDISNFNWMLDNHYIPYQNIPDEPGRSVEEIKTLGLQYFPYSPYGFEMAMAIYDWTTADFTRIDFFNIFTYSEVNGAPSDMDSIAKGIWSADWPPYTPKNKDYMNSFLMTPAESLANVQQQLKEQAPILNAMNLSENNIIMAALAGMPRTSTIAKPNLYSGQVAIANLGTGKFASYFTQLPANSDPSLPPIEMNLQKAIDSFMAVGQTLTLKTFMSFTDSFDDAMHYSNGIVICVSPSKDTVTWQQATYITPLSDGPTKVEYLFNIGTKFLVKNITNVKYQGKALVQFDIQIQG
ncbi:MAG: hypothetical protein ACSHW0_00920 [Thalassotalea sp.]